MDVIHSARPRLTQTVTLRIVALGWRTRRDTSPNCVLMRSDIRSESQPLRASSDLASRIGLLAAYLMVLH